MAVKLVILPEAETDMAEAYAWYEEQRAGLGEDFFSRVDACIKAVQRSPEMHAFYHETYRRGLVRQFPYVVFYEYANDTVTVYCVFHTSQNPAKWRKRLP